MLRQASRVWPGTASTAQLKVGSRRRTSVEWSAYLYLLPAGLPLVVFGIWPIVFGFWISLWRWGISPERFVGLNNYVRLFTQELIVQDSTGQWVLGEVGQSAIVTVYYAMCTVPASVCLAFLIAYLLFEGTPLRDVLRTVYFLPYVTSVVAAGTVFLWIFDPQIGIANSVLSGLGLPTQTWLQDPDPILKKLLNWVHMEWASTLPDALGGPSVALTVVVLFSIWSSLGFDVAIYLAGLTSISPDVLDAADVDGAGAWQRVRHVILPLVSPTTFFLLVTSVIKSLQAFNQIFVLSGGGYRGQAGGPLGTTRVLTVDIFHNFYEAPSSVGYAASVSMFLLACVLLLTYTQFRVLGRRTFYG